MIAQQSYVGSELELFAKATNWKRYISRTLRPYIAELVIEVGAGLGNTTKYLCDRMHLRWLCLDPDPRHVAHLEARIAAGDLLPCCEARCGVLADLPPQERADTIIYIDVLEHIENDEDEMREAASRLTTGGHIVALSPAFNFLYNPFDEAVGHFRRYTPRDAPRLTVHSLNLSHMFFLDSLGFFASAANQLIMRRSQPSINQIQIWDKALIPLSAVADKVLGGLFGKSIVMIWQKV
jgi:SAM-dependent methyltransferase